MNYLRNIVTFLLLITGFFSCQGSNPLDGYDDKSKEVIVPNSSLVKIMSFNIYGGRAAGLYKSDDFDKLAEVIRAKDPDFVILNEVDSASVRSKGTVHFAELAKRLEMYSAYAVALDFSTGGTYGDAILSKYPILEERDFKMDYDRSQTEGSSEMRAICAVRSKVAGKEIWVVATHLDHRSVDWSRYYQAQQLADLTKNMQGRMFIGGDFNATPDSRTMQKVYETFQPCYLTDKQYTFPSKMTSDSPRSLIDYVMFRKPDKGIVRKGYEVVQNTASDHCAVLATFQIY